MNDSRKVITYNRAVRHAYEITETLECGIVLTGTEVKALRQHGCSIKEAWCDVVDGELVIKQMHITPYEQGNIFNVDPMRIRKLLVHKRVIEMIERAIQTKGLTCVPLEVYFKGSHVKVEVGIARGLKLYDKREKSAKETAKRDIERALKNSVK